MAPIVDPDRSYAYRDALSNWRFEDYIQFSLNEQAYKFIQVELQGIPLRDVKRRMHEHVEQGGGIDEVRETRPEWSGQYEFHHDLRLRIFGILVYVETRLSYRIPVIADDSWILVVNVHAA